MADLASPVMSKRTARLAVVTPLANERGVIDELVARVMGQLGPADRMFCVFDRVCTDGSVERARELALLEPRLTVVWAPENTCVVDAYFRGYREALSGGFDWILEMDGGLSHLPEEIPKFIEAMAAGYDFAGGSRLMAGGGFSGPFFRRMVSRGGTILANLLLGTRMRDMTSGFECFTHAALSRVVAMGVRSRAHFFQTEIRYAMHALRWTEIPIHYGCPSQSVGKDSLSEALRTLWKLFRERRKGKSDGIERGKSDGAAVDVRGDEHPGADGMRSSPGAGSVGP
ncbi:MAG: dolichol-phosphate mannosyltransferase [Phycisphaerales bacterium]|nr:dolichol-phosphate mannosyltransferase [Phycisphaerales bacterium]